MRADLLRHLEADNGGLPREFCDKHGGYVDEGRTRPMATGSPYRICDGCVDEAQRRIIRAESYCETCGYLVSFHTGDGRCPQELGSTGARALAGEERAVCGEKADVTAGAGAWEVGTCWLDPGHDGDCDYQVERPEAVR